MKRKIWGLAAIVLALSLSAYTNKPVEKKAGAFYWFPLDPGTGDPQPVNMLYYQSFDPAGCVFLGLGDWCTAAFTSYSGTGPYYAAGMEAIIHVHLYP